MALVPIALWSVLVEPGKPHIIEDLDAPVQITSAALGSKLIDANGRTTVKLRYTMALPRLSESDDEEADEEDGEVEKLAPHDTVLCSLTPGKVEQALLNLTLVDQGPVTFELVGKNPVYLTGNYISLEGNVPYNDASDSEEEDAFALDEVSSDVMMDPDELDELDGIDDEGGLARIQEVDSDEDEVDVPTGSKRPRASDMSEVVTAETIEGAVSKNQKKKLAKKLKAEAGNAVPVLTSLQTNGSTDVPVEKKDKKDKKDKGDSVPKVLPPGLKVQDRKEGEGPGARKGQRVSMRYVGKLTDETVFDSNTKGKPFSFKLGAGEVIKGWDEGIVGMKVGGERQLVIPPNLGYGNKPSGPIPKNSTLRFEVKLVSLK